MTALFTCKACGGSKLKPPEPSNQIPPDDYIMCCKDCGAEVATWKEVHDRAMQLATERAKNPKLH